MRILELELLTADLDSTKQFYNGIIGLPIVFTDDSSIKFSAGFSVLTFHLSADGQPVYHFAFNIPANKFEEILHWAVPVLNLIPVTPSGFTADFKSWNAKAFYFYDNNKNVVEMIARFDLNDHLRQPFEKSYVYSISEIGAVVENPKSFARHLLTGYGVDFFSKQPPMDDFIAVGDDKGLFIIVTKNRKWYPTDTLSTKHWSRVTLQLPVGLTTLIIT